MANNSTNILRNIYLPPYIAVKLSALVISIEKQPNLSWTLE